MATVRGICNVCSEVVTTAHRGRVRSTNNKYVHAECRRKMTLRLCRECHFPWMSAYDSSSGSEFWPSDWAIVSDEIEYICADCGSKYDSTITKRNSDLFHYP